MKKSNLLITFITLIVLISCSNTDINESSSDIENEHVIGIEYDYPTSSNFESVIEEADLIVSGHYQDIDSKWNMARNPNNPDLDDEEYFTEGIIYNFSIDEVFYSSSDFNNSSILVNLRHFERIDVTLDNGSVESIDYIDPFFIEPSSNQKYVLFLQFNPQFDHYYAASEPFQFTVDNNELKAKSNLFEEDKSNITKYNNIIVQGPSFGNIPDEFSGTEVEELEQLILKLKK